MADVIVNDRGRGKTTTVADEIVDLLGLMRTGEIPRRGIAIVTPTHHRQKSWHRALEEALARKQTFLVKQDSVEIYNEQSMIHRRGSDPGYVFVDDAHEFEESAAELVEAVWPRTEHVVITATPVDNTLIMLAWWDEHITEQRRRALEEAQRLEREAQDAFMIAFMLAKIEGHI